MSRKVFVWLVLGIQISALIGIGARVRSLSAERRELEIVGSPSSERTEQLLESAALRLGFRWSARSSPMGPPLTLRDGKGQVRCSGESSVADLMKAEAARAEAATRAMSAPVIVVALILLAGAAPVWCGMLALATPVVLGVAAAALSSPCVACGTGDLNVLSFAGLFVGVMAVASPSVVWRRPSRGLLPGVLVPCVSLSLLAVQGLLQWHDPKLCLWCVSVSVCLCVVGWTSLAAKDEHTVRFAPGRGVKLAFAATLALCVLVHYRALTGAVSVSQPSHVTAFELSVGQSIVGFVPGIKLPNQSGVLLVSLPGCRACDLARDDLRRRGIRFREISPCTLVQRTNCLDTSGKPCRAPMFLRVDSIGTITFAETGWPSRSSSVDYLTTMLKQPQSGER